MSRPEMKKKGRRAKKGYGVSSMRRYVQEQPDKQAIVLSPGIGVANRAVGKYRYVEAMQNRFNTAVAQNVIAYNLNSMDVLFNGGSQADIPFFTKGGPSYSYNRYRVVRSAIQVEVGSREALNFQNIVVWPSPTLPAIASAGDWTSVAGIPGAKHFLLGPATGGANKHILRSVCDPQKLIGPEYLQQDEYSGTITQQANIGINDPTTFLYWGIAFYNPNVNTVTTGGISCQVTLVQTVELYEPRRDASWA